MCAWKVVGVPTGKAAAWLLTTEKSLVDTHAAGGVLPAGLPWWMLPGAHVQPQTQAGRHLS